jgi:hypothetical protein
VLRDYLPAVDANGVACMFEAVSGTFVYNGGSGAFTAGSDVTVSPFRYEYRKSGGAWALDRWVI